MLGLSKTYLAVGVATARSFTTAQTSVMTERIMNRIYIVLVLILTLFGCKSNQIKSNANNLSQEAISAKYGIAIERAESDGLELFTSYISPDRDKEPNAGELELKEMLKAQMCEGNYEPLTIIRKEKELESIYFLLMPPKDNGVQFGRHFRMDFKLGTNDIDSVTFSTKGCILIPAQEKAGGSQAVGLFITHLLSETPTEFHVFLNHYHKKPIFVSTKQGVWKIENGKINLT